VQDETVPPEWHQITVPQPALCYGRPLRDFLATVLTAALSEITTVVVNRVDGAGDSDRGLHRLDCARLATEEFFFRLGFTEQMDWGDFYFFRETDDAAVLRICGGCPVAEAIGVSALTIRIIDDAELNIFTTDADLVAHVRTLSPGSHAIAVQLSEIVYPS